MKNAILILKFAMTLFLSSSTLCAQVWSPSIGIGNQGAGTFRTELGITYARGLDIPALSSGSDGLGPSISLPDASLNFSLVGHYSYAFANQQRFFGGEFGLSFLCYEQFWGTRLRTGLYTSPNQSLLDLRLTPEVGLHFLGVVQLWYGYSFGLQPQSFEHLGRHRITFTLAWPLNDY